MRSAGFAPALAVLLLLLLAGAPARADGAKQMPAHKITQLESYTEVEPMYATIMDDGRPIGLLLVAIGLNVPDADLRARAARAMPVLRDAYVLSLLSFAATAVRPWKQPDVAAIANRMQRVTDRTLRAKGAQVLLTQVAIRITK